MLSINDYNHLKLLYEQFFKSNSHIASLINQDDWDSVDIAIQQKESLLRQIIFFEKPRLDKIKQNKELNQYRLKLVELEKQNIELVKTMKQKLIADISNVKKAKKILNTYEPVSNKSVSTFEVRDDA